MKKTTRNKLLLLFTVATLLSGAFLTATWLLASTSNRNPDLTLYLEVTPSASHTDSNFSFLIPGVIPTTQTTSALGYNLTRVALGTIVNIDLHFNSTEAYRASISPLAANGTANPYPKIFSQIPTSAIQSQNLTVYIEYSASGQWLFGRLPLYRDAYLYAPGFDTPIEFSTTDTIVLLYALGAASSLPFTTFILAELIPEWRRTLLAYFPWITFTLSFIMIWGFVFIGTPTDYERTLGVIPDIFATIPHFSTGHLLGNLTRGFIIAGVLLESWVGFAEQTLLKRRFHLIAAMILMDLSSNYLLSFLGSAFNLQFLQIGGFGASYTVEVWATLLMVVVFTKQEALERTDFLRKIYPLLAGIAGFALLNYVYEWFLAGFVLGGGPAEAALATNHIIAFLLGLTIIGLFYGLERLSGHVRRRRASGKSVFTLR